MKQTYYKHIVIQQPTEEKIQEALDKLQKDEHLVDIVEAVDGFMVVLVITNE